MASGVLPDPDFSDSQQLRNALNIGRRNLHRLAMQTHIFASEMEAALRTIPAPSGTVMPRSVQRRRARRVARHMNHSAECIVAASAAMVRTWAEFRRQYYENAAPIRGRRGAFKVIPE